MLAANGRLALKCTAVIFLPRGVRLIFDNVRKKNILLGPERALILDDISFIILDRLDGKVSIREMCKEFSENFNAPLYQVRDDVVGLLNELTEKRLLEIKP